MKKALVLLTIVFLAGVFIQAETQAAEHEVQKGDSLWKIGDMLGFTTTELEKMNNLSPSAIIMPGDKLIYFNNHDIERALVNLGLKFDQIMKNNNLAEHNKSELLFLLEALSGDLFYQRIKFDNSFSPGMHFSVLLDILNGKDLLELFASSTKNKTS